MRKQLIIAAAAAVLASGCGGGESQSDVLPTSTSSTTSASTTTEPETSTSSTSPSDVDTLAVTCWAESGIDLLADEWAQDVLATRGTPLHQQTVDSFSEELKDRQQDLEDEGCGGEVELAQAGFDLALLALPVLTKGEGTDVDYIKVADSLNAWVATQEWYEGEGFALP